MERTKFDVGLVIPLEEEFDTLAAVFDGAELIPDDTNSPPAVDFYSLDGPEDLRIVAIRCEKQGPEHSAIATERLLHRYDVKLLCQIGIAGSLSPEIMLGDVVVPMSIWAYHQRGKWSQDSKGAIRFGIGGAASDADPPALRQVDRLRRGGQDGAYRAWRDAAAAKRPNIPIGLQEEKDVGRAPSCRMIDTLASGPFVMTSPKFWDTYLQEGNRLAEAVEMEAAGIGAATRLWEMPFLVMRGISDFADGRKKQLDADRSGAWRQYAVENATTLLKTVLPRCVAARTGESAPSRASAAVRHGASQPRRTTATAQTEPFRIGELLSGDLLRAYRAGRTQSVPPHEIKSILHQAGATPVDRRAAREALRKRPQWTADAMRAAILEARKAGPVSTATLRIADLATPELAPHLAEDVAAELRTGDRLLQGAALAALGRMGATAWAPDALDLATKGGAKDRTLATWAAIALARMFRYGASRQRAAGELLEALIRAEPDHRHDAGPVLRMRSLTEDQQAVLRSWAGSEHGALIELAALALRAAPDDWAAPMLRGRATRPGLSDDAARTVLTTVGAIGGRSDAEALLALPPADLRSGLARGRDAGLARCVHALHNEPDLDRHLDDLAYHQDPDVRLFAIRSLGLLPDPRPHLIQAGLADPEPLVRAAAALAGARTHVLDAAAVEERLAKAVEGLPRALVTAALLLKTGREELVLEISESVSAVSLQIDRLLEDDLVRVLRDAGGQTGADLADAIRWLADEDY